jgi:hypothetical protein
MPFGVIFSRTKSLAGLLPRQHSTIEEFLNALALIGTTCFDVAHLKMDTSTRGMHGWKSSMLLPMTND